MRSSKSFKEKKKIYFVQFEINILISDVGNIIYEQKNIGKTPKNVNLHYILISWTNTNKSLLSPRIYSQAQAIEIKKVQRKNENKVNLSNIIQFLSSIGLSFQQIFKTFSYFKELYIKSNFNFLEEVGVFPQDISQMIQMRVKLLARVKLNVKKTQSFSINLDSTSHNQREFLAVRVKFMETKIMLESWKSIISLNGKNYYLLSKLLIVVELVKQRQFKKLGIQKNDGKYGVHRA